MKQILSLMNHGEPNALLTFFKNLDFEHMVVKRIFLQSDSIKAKYHAERFIENIFGVDVRGPGDYIEKMEGFLQDLPNQEWFAELNNGLFESFEFLSDSMSDFDALFDGFGIDIPEGLDLLPGATEIILGARLLMDYKDVKKEFNDMSAENQNRVIMAKTLVTLSRFGVTTTLTTLGGISGGAVGGMIGGVGAVVGGPAGALTGAYTASQMNKKIMPHSREMIFSLLNIDTEDLFYYKNKEKIDTIGQRLRALKLQLQNEG